MQSNFFLFGFLRHRSYRYHAEGYLELHLVYFLNHLLCLRWPQRQFILPGLLDLPFISPFLMKYKSVQSNYFVQLFWFALILRLFAVDTLPVPNTSFSSQAIPSTINCHNKQSRRSNNILRFRAHIFRKEIKAKLLATDFG